MIEIDQLITTNSHMQTMLTMARKAANSSAAILIEGETGTGKEVLAQYIHQHSRYASGPFVAINCAAIPETMIEAVLFGYEKGAFTSAINTYVGKFEQAHNGTLFLDEIAEMSVDLQAKFLRVLQENEVERLGGSETHKVDMRVIAATNQHLKQQVANKQFRSDLYYRLNVINLKCLPLRNRTDDIIPLAKHFINIYSQDLDKSASHLSDNAINMLMQHTWPGNIRELQNVMHRAVIMDEDNFLDEKDILLSVDDTISTIIEMNKDVSLRAKEAEAIISMLKETKGCRIDAARRLMISPRTLRHKISKLKEIGVDIP